MYKNEDSLFNNLKRRFAEAVSRNMADGILFSGGLDSALVAAYAKNSKAVFLGLESYGEDRYYADKAVKFLKLDHYCRIVTIDEAIAAIPDVIKILESFDPAIPNDVTAYFGIKCAKDMGIKRMMTGDGSDEIFAGYDFMLEIKDLTGYLTRMHSAMQFSSNKIGKDLGIEIKQPFLDKEFMDFSQKIDLDLKIRKENQKTLGKWILRKAFEGVLPQEILWQKKRPLETGSGMTKLRKVIESRVSNEEFEEGKREFSIRFWNKEHFYYYRVYRQVIGEIPAPGKEEKICKCCGAGIDQNAFHCKVCGDVIEWKKIRN